MYFLLYIKSLLFEKSVLNPQTIMSTWSFSPKQNEFRTVWQSLYVKGLKPYYEFHLIKRGYLNLSYFPQQNLSICSMFVKKTLSKIRTNVFGQKNNSWVREPNKAINTCYKLSSKSHDSNLQKRILSVQHHGQHSFKNLLCTLNLTL